MYNFYRQIFFRILLTFSLTGGIFLLSAENKSDSIPFFLENARTYALKQDTFQEYFFLSRVKYQGNTSELLQKRLDLLSQSLQVQVPPEENQGSASLVWLPMLCAAGLMVSALVFRKKYLLWISLPLLGLAAGMFFMPEKKPESAMLMMESGMRAEPSSAAPEAGILPRGEIVLVREYGDVFTRIYARGQEGYIHSEFLLKLNE